jgi:hypothetical protein
MTHVFREFASVVAIVALASSASAAPVIGLGVQDPLPRAALDLPLVTINCEDEESEQEPPSDGEGGGPFGGGSGRLTQAQDQVQDSDFRIFKACDGKGQNIDPPGSPTLGDVAEASVERAIEHCRTYTDVWRVDCLSNELERMASALPNDRSSRKAKAEIRAAAAKLKAIAEANADPAQPAVRRAVEIDGTKRTTTRPITPVAPARVVATNLAAEQVISELSTTLLRSAGSANAAEFSRVAAAVDSTKVLLRST